MATVTQNVTNSGSVTITLASLANASSAVSSAVDNSSNKYLEALIQVKVRTNAAGTSATGVTNVFLVRSADGGTTYDDNTRVLLGTLPTNANGTTYIGTFSTAPVGALGTHWKAAVENRSGAALDSTGGNHAVVFAGVKYDVA